MLAALLFAKDDGEDEENWGLLMVDLCIHSPSVSDTSVIIMRLVFGTCTMHVSFRIFFFFLFFFFE